MVVADAQDTLVEELVVQSAQAHAIGDLIRALERPPADVRGIQPDRTAREQAVVAAERALVLIREQDVLAELRTAGSAKRIGAPPSCWNLPSA